MRKVYWLSVTFLILVKSSEDRRRREYDKDETEERYLSVTSSPNGGWVVLEKKGKVQSGV